MEQSHDIIFPNQETEAQSLRMTDPVTSQNMIRDIHPKPFCPFEIKLKRVTMPIFPLKDLRIFYKHEFIHLIPETFVFLCLAYLT